MSKKRKIPFHLMPGSWGLKGKTRENARAEYELEGYDLEVKLTQLNRTGPAMETHLNSIDYRYHKKTEEEYEYKDFEINFNKTSKGYKSILAKLDLKYSKINQSEYDKTIATENGEPWVTVSGLKPNLDNPQHGEMELDWNDNFIDFLKEHGYEATVDEQIVDLWLGDLCKNIAMEQFTGVGDFDEKVGESFIKKSTKNEDGTWAAK